MAEMTIATTGRAFWVTAPRHGAIREEVVAPPGVDEVLVDTLYSGISRGTEALVFGGHVPPSEHQRMRAPFQQGDFPAPVKYGYASVGHVAEGPSDLVGRTVFALYPHQTRYVVPASAAFVVPEDVSPGRAILAANLETAINGVWDSPLAIGDRVAVIGAGTVGCLVARLVSQTPGCTVELVDLDSSRGAIADAFGTRFATPESVSDNADLVFHTSGSPAGLQLALRVAGFEATIIDMSWYGDRMVALALGEAFHARRLRVQSSQVGTVATRQRARWSHRRRMELALRLLADPTFDLLVTGESPFEQLPEVMARLAERPGGTLCHRIRY